MECFSDFLAQKSLEVVAGRQGYMPQCHEIAPMQWPHWPVALHDGGSGQKGSAAVT